MKRKIEEVYESNIEDFPVSILENISRFCNIKNLLYCNKKLKLYIDNQTIRKQISKFVIKDKIYGGSLSFIRKKVKQITSSIQFDKELSNSILPAKDNAPIEKIIRELQSNIKIGTMERHLILILILADLKLNINIKLLNTQFWNPIIIEDNVNNCILAKDFLNSIIEEDLILDKLDIFSFSKTLNLYKKKVSEVPCFVPSTTGNLDFFVSYELTDKHSTEVIEDIRSFHLNNPYRNASNINNTFTHVGLNTQAVVSLISLTRKSSFSLKKEKSRTKPDILSMLAYRSITSNKYDSDYQDLIRRYIQYEYVLEKDEYFFSVKSRNFKVCNFYSCVRKAITKLNDYIDEDEILSQVFYYTYNIFINYKMEETCITLKNHFGQREFKTFIYHTNSEQEENIANICCYMVLSNIYKTNSIEIDIKYKMLCSLYLGNYNEIKKLKREIKRSNKIEKDVIDMKKFKMELPINVNIINCLNNFNISYSIKFVSLYLKKLFMDEIAFSDNFNDIKKRTYLIAAISLLENIKDEQLYNMLILCEHISNKTEKLIMVNTLIVVLHSTRNYKFDKTFLHNNISLSFRTIMEQRLKQFTGNINYSFRPKNQLIVHLCLFLLKEINREININKVLIDIKDLMNKSETCFRMSLKFIFMFLYDIQDD